MTLNVTTPQALSLAQRKAQERLRPAKAQEPCDLGLFSQDAAQVDLLDLLQRQA